MNGTCNPLLYETMIEDKLCYNVATVAFREMYCIFKYVAIGYIYLSLLKAIAVHKAVPKGSKPGITRRRDELRRNFSGV